MINRKKLALIHIVKKELGLSDDEYRRILFRAAGVRSATELDETKFRRLMNHIVRSRHYRVNAHGMTLKQKIFIQSLVRQLRWEKEHLDNFLHKYYHKGELLTLTRTEAAKVIESLKHIKANRAKEKTYETDYSFP